MKILFFDTETTGLPKNWKAPVHQLDNWPRLVQIAWQVYSSNGDLLEEHEHVIKPIGFTIPSQASAVHKITTEKALEIGVDLLTILKAFSSSVNSCGLLVAHNYSYDYNIMGAELLRNGLENSLKGKEHICTMKSSTEFCKIPGPRGYKWPKLEELYDILFSESFNAHDALDDIKATARCFWELEKKKVIKITDKINEFDINVKDWNAQYLKSLLRNFKSSSENKDVFVDDFSNKKIPSTNSYNRGWKDGIGIYAEHFCDKKYERNSTGSGGEDGNGLEEKQIAFTGTCTKIGEDSVGNQILKKYHYYKGSLVRFKSYNNGRLLRSTKLYNKIIWEDIEFYLDKSNLKEEEMIIDLELEDYDDLKNYLTKKFEYSCLEHNNCEHTKRVNYAIDGSIKSIWNYEGSVLKNIKYNKPQDNGKTEGFSQLKKAPFTMKKNPYKVKFENWECSQEFFSENGNFKLLHTYHFTPIDWFKPADFNGCNLENYGYSQEIHKCDGVFSTKKPSMQSVFEEDEDNPKMYPFALKRYNHITHRFIGNFSSSSGPIVNLHTSGLPIDQISISNKQEKGYLAFLLAPNYSAHQMLALTEEYIKFISTLDNEIETPICYYVLGLSYDSRGEQYWVDDDEEFKLWRSKFHDAKPGDYFYQFHLSKKELEEWELRNSGGGFYSPPR